MDELLYKLLEQTPTIIVLGVGIYSVWKEKSSLMIDAKADKLAHFTTIEKMSKTHQAELKELNSYVRSREIEHIDTLKDLCTLMEQISDDISNLKKK